MASTYVRRIGRIGTICFGETIFCILTLVLVDNINHISNYHTDLHETVRLLFVTFLQQLLFFKCTI